MEGFPGDRRVHGRASRVSSSRSPADGPPGSRFPLVLSFVRQRILPDQGWKARERSGSTGNGGHAPLSRRPPGSLQQAACGFAGRRAQDPSRPEGRAAESSHVRRASSRAGPLAPRPGRLANPDRPEPPGAPGEHRIESDLAAASRVSPELRSCGLRQEGPAQASGRGQGSLAVNPSLSGRWPKNHRPSSSLRTRRGAPIRHGIDEHSVKLPARHEGDPLLSRQSRARPFRRRSPGGSCAQDFRPVGSKGRTLSCRAPPPFAS